MRLSFSSSDDSSNDITLTQSSPVGMVASNVTVQRAQNGGYGLTLRAIRVYLGAGDYKICHILEVCVINIIHSDKCK